MGGCSTAVHSLTLSLSRKGRGDPQVQSRVAWMKRSGIQDGGWRGSPDFIRATAEREELKQSSLDEANWHPVTPLPSLGKTRLDRLHRSLRQSQPARWAVSRLRSGRNPGRGWRGSPDFIRATTKREELKLWSPS